MALISCKECGSEISDKALSCPKCGVPIVAAKVVLVLQGIPRRIIGAKQVDVFLNGKMMGSVDKGDTRRFEFDSGGTLEFVTKAPMAGTKRVAMIVEDGAKLGFVAEIGGLGGFSVGEPAEGPTYFVGFTRDLDF